MRTEFAGVGLVAAALMVCACGSSQGEPNARSRDADALPVRVAEATVRDVTYEIKAVGSLEAEELVRITGAVEGVATEVRFHEGDRVTPDTILVRIDPRRYDLEAERAEAAYRKAVADHERARADLVRREELAAQQLVPVEELNRARQEAERLAAEVEAVRAARDLAIQDRDLSEVRPPRPGVIDTRTIETGQWVQEGMVLGTLVDTRRLRLRFKVSDAESLRARTGQEVGVRVTALGDRRFTARIYHVGEVADPATRQVEVLAWVDNPGVLKPGFFAEVSFAAESRHAAVVVPEGAVQASEQGFVVYVVERGEARSHPVELGLRTGDGSVEVRTGLVGGETVVIEGSDRLREGVAVTATETP